MTQENENQKNKKNSARKHSRKGDIQQSAEYRVASIALELTALTKELVFQNKEKEARAAELEEMNFNLIVQYDEKEKRANELILANIELMFQSVEKEKRATDLAIIKLKCAQKEARALELERDYNEKEALNRQISHKQKLESIGRLTSGIAHDFNNILASILGYNEMNQFVASDITDKALREELENNTKQVHDAGKRAAVLIEKMLMYCRQDVGEKIMDIMPTQALIKEVLEVLNTTLLTDEITIEATLECANDIQIDAFELHQILTDLATNARDAMKEQGGIIHISLRTVSDIKANCVACAGEIAGDFLELSVSDNGTGIEPQIMSRIFDPFFTTKQQGEGTGLGLSTLSGIVHHSNGHILVCSNTTQPNQGTTFKLLFPILKMV